MKKIIKNIKARAPDKMRECVIMHLKYGKRIENYQFP